MSHNTFLLLVRAASTRGITTVGTTRPVSTAANDDDDISEGNDDGNK
jgi:hypothetical protein